MAIVFDVVAKACTEATSSLKVLHNMQWVGLSFGSCRGFMLGLGCRQDIHLVSGGGLLAVGFLVAWAVAMVSKSMGIA